MKKTIILFAILFSMQLVAQEEIKQNALVKFQNQEWEEAEKGFEKYLKKNNKDSSSWYRLGVTQLRSGKFEESVKSLKEARRTNFNPMFVLFNLSKSYAQLKDETSMITALKEASELGLPSYSQLTSDPIFANYQQDAEFIKILNKVKINAYPCLGIEENRHFDFWLGEWDVFLPNGVQAGSNSITLDESGCAINEYYTTAGGFGGQSINFYDPGDKKWHQYWVDSRGGVLNYSETKREKGMLQFVSNVVNPTNGNISLSRLTFTLNDDGTVRQLFENSTDEGKTWTPGFDGLYRRKNTTE